MTPIKEPPLYAMFYENGGRHGVSEAGCAARAGIYNPDTGREATSIEAYEMGLKAATQWQPIETAPRDGQMFIWSYWKKVDFP